ncbi:putative selenate ABC transporter substrate-binding protein [Amphritea sp. 2_MG-2023]|jgi:phosphonate transport system substrate-binding protein|uniref:putative selenate ABC transporter substrate-binding protein n=1 Tax=Amphritea TaxID=515417 RepID=UPI001C07DFBE|nr:MULTISPECIES: putative selenate ABC transporter substrate-binding protein [Amphritea]MBU2967648.1 putative selenate ABC transporter substrate-binding protein [Amphritea atlantica]MDO6420562.1 putative selenate ABC transporter substrate-binding protein [Amphritea sp. 2_MG-2023]
MFRILVRGLLLMLLTGAVNAAPVFVFTAIPDQDETQLKLRFQKIADYLQEELQTEVRFVPVKSYAATITAFRNNQVQLAWFGGLSGVKARELVPGSVALAQGIEDPEFKSFFIANSSTGLTPADSLPESVRDMTFTFGSKGSTSGRLMPEYYLREQFGESPNDVFSRVGFSGNHSRTIALVESGAYQLGALNYKVWEAAVADGNVDTSKVQVIWETPTYPDYQWTLRGDMDAVYGEGFSDRVKQALLKMTDPELLRSFPRSGFIPASNKDFEPVRKVAKAVGLLD